MVYPLKTPNSSDGCAGGGPSFRQHTCRIRLWRQFDDSFSERFPIHGTHRESREAARRIRRQRFASALGFAAVGTDNCGFHPSARRYCGVVGLKPTYGRVSPRGVIPMSPSLDHVGPSPLVYDAALMLQVMSDFDSGDPCGRPSLAAALDLRPTNCALAYPENSFLTTSIPRLPLPPKTDRAFKNSTRKSAKSAWKSRPTYPLRRRGLRLSQTPGSKFAELYRARDTGEDPGWSEISAEEFIKPAKSSKPAATQSFKYL